MKEFAKFRLGPYSKRDEFDTVGEVNERKFKVFLLGDAAISVNFRFGRGLNTGIKGAISLTRTLARVMTNSRTRNADFVEHHGHMHMLQRHEVDIRSVEVMRETNILPNFPTDPPSDDSSCTEQYKEKVSELIRGRIFDDSRLSTGLHNSSSDKYERTIGSLDQGFAHNLLLSKPWPNSTAGGKEVEVAKAWWVPDQAR